MQWWSTIYTVKYSKLDTFWMLELQFKAKSLILMVAFYFSHFTLKTFSGSRVMDFTNFSQIHENSRNFIMRKTSMVSTCQIKLPRKSYLFDLQNLKSDWKTGGWKKEITLLNKYNKNNISSMVIYFFPNASSFKFFRTVLFVANMVQISRWSFGLFSETRFLIFFSQFYLRKSLTLPKMRPEWPHSLSDLILWFWRRSNQTSCRYRLIGICFSTVENILTLKLLAICNSS